MQENVSSAGCTKKLISLTFDDGPHPRYTMQICNLLKKYEVLATFFFSGIMAEKHSDIVKHVQQSGHEIGNHGYSHKSLRRQSKECILQEIEKTNQILESILQEEVSLFRPPFLRYGVNLLFVLKKLNLRMVLANISPKDFKRESAVFIKKQVLKKAKHGSIVVFHDGGNNQKITIEALEVIIPELQKRGFQLVPVSFLINQKKNTTISHLIQSHKILK